MDAAPSRLKAKANFTAHKHTFFCMPAAAALKLAFVTIELRRTAAISTVDEPKYPHGKTSHCLVEDILLIIAFTAQNYVYAHGNFEDILELPWISGQLVLGELEANCCCKCNENFTSAYAGAASCCKKLAV